MSRDRDLEHLHPVARRMWFETQEDVERYGVRMMVYETARNERQQAIDYAVGRDAHGNVIGPILTNASPGASFHGICYPNGTACSFALHAAVIRPGGLLGLGKDEYVGGTPDLAALKIMEAVCLIAQRHGWRCGMNWDRDTVLREKGEWDLHHLEWAPAPLSQIVAAINAQGDIHELIGRRA